MVRLQNPQIQKGIAAPTILLGVYDSGSLVDDLGNAKVQTPCSNINCCGIKLSDQDEAFLLKLTKVLPDLTPWKMLPDNDLACMQDNGSRICLRFNQVIDRMQR
jgi:hypothetical protein